MTLSSALHIWELRMFVSQHLPSYNRFYEFLLFLIVETIDLVILSFHISRQTHTKLQHRRLENIKCLISFVLLKLWNANFQRLLFSKFDKRSFTLTFLHAIITQEIQLWKASYDIVLCDEKELNTQNFSEIQFSVINDYK